MHPNMYLNFLSYLYGDLYAGAIWAGIENPENSGNFTTTKVPFTCAQDSPIQCSFTPGTSQAALGYIFSFGEDNNKDIFILASSGVYRVVSPSRCNYKCSKENVTSVSSPSPTSSPPSLATRLSNSFSYLVIILFSSMMMFLPCLM